MLLLPLLVLSQLQEALSAQTSCLCQFKSQCMGHFDSLAAASTTTCRLTNGAEGFCCDLVIPSPPRLSMRTSGKSNRRRLPRPSKKFSSQQITNSLEARRRGKELEQEPDLETLGHFQFGRPKKSSKGLYEEAARLFDLDNVLGITTLSGDESKLSGFSAENSNEVEASCSWTNQKKPVCERNAKYRTADGSCNHPRNDLFGAAETPFNRILEATYFKNGNSPRNTSTNGQELPSARLVSQTVFKAGDSRQEEISALFMQFGQFLDHDLTDSPNGEPEGPPRCCLPDSRNRKWIFPEDGNNDQPATCFPIKVPEDDSFWGRRGRR